MKNELLLSAAILPMCGMAGEAIAASPTKGCLLYTSDAADE